VARYEWLRQALDFDPGRLPARPCAAYLRWKAELEAEAATLVFTSAYLNNPASLFGHTLLRLDRRGESGSTPLLAHAVGYAADDRGSKCQATPGIDPLATSGTDPLHGLMTG
jgi:hypothetical protein